MTIQPTTIYATRGRVPLTPSDGPGLRPARTTARFCDFVQAFAEQVETQLSALETPLGADPNYSRVTNAEILSVDLCDPRLAPWAARTSPTVLITLRVETLADNGETPVLTLPAIFVGVEADHTGDGSPNVMAQVFLIDSVIGFDSDHPVMNGLAHGAPTAQGVSGPVVVSTLGRIQGARPGPSSHAIELRSLYSLVDIIQAELLREAVAMRAPGAER